MKETAVIFYAWQSNSPMTGDFVLLALAESKILLSYSLGDSPITLISSDKLVMRRQYVIEAIFSGERLSLSINSKTPQYNFIPKQFKKKHLNIDSPAYIGYIPNGLFVLSAISLFIYSL
ncbi:unnamed protein product [Anisakis simplex]|uniref:LAM_G_DOMAIN domain-containing protein n=1 Tax=Anisakis simplex TaxID=6269 RepID=A0A0M3KIN7_ANISI|nr:unnamed protein product [Anisakis simplex]